MSTISVTGVTGTFDNDDIVQFSGSGLIDNKYYYQVYDIDDKYYITSISIRRICVVMEQFNIQNKNPFLWFIERLI